ncbi:glycoside hydrolase family 43 protein [Streptomyces heilongjiangensis]|uniref:Family 43 glycosylhydrolase n=1 Tax=Streptomyces heilongjiangensis TaxID=945052 RepID=A0ABW1BIK2_9ACTN|nr:glycoside hydrolase family 43 protein [Streptomyces heilongjiangensis]MDC2951965.1 family 43 glycosylhydrolase [Streptomyces heilongjiangensis]
MAPQRPVIPGFHPDPSICRVDDTYYLVNSSFEYAPGVPLLRSTDLRAWTQIGNVLDRPSQLDVSAADPSGGIFAPTLRHHDGRFWMITTNFSDQEGQLLVWAEDPSGPWSDPVRLPDTVGIDPDLAWDEDGTCYLTYAGFGPQGPEGIVQSVIDPVAGTVLTPRRRLWQGTGGKFPEGPHLYLIDGYWYLLIAEGGTERGHAVTIARGPSPAGPFEPAPDNPVLTHRGTDAPVQNTGHADLVQRPDGTWAMVYHGVRPRGSSPEWHVLGRETFAQDVEWHDGWPVLTHRIEPVTAPGTPTVERLEARSGTELPPTWVANGRHPSDVVSWERDGWRVTAAGNEPVFVARRQEHLYARVCARLDVRGTDDSSGSDCSGRGGLTVRIDPHHALSLECAAGSVEAVATIGDVRQVLGRHPLDATAELEVRVVEAPGPWHPCRQGPDRLVAGVVTSEGFGELGHLDGRYLSTEVAGGMTGRMIGVSCAAGSVLIRSFTYRGADDPAVLAPAAKS